MGIELSKPFGDYVAVKELDPVGDGRRFCRCLPVSVWRDESGIAEKRWMALFRYAGGFGWEGRRRWCLSAWDFGDWAAQV